MVLRLWIVACESLISDCESVDRGFERRFHHRHHRHNCMWIGAGSVNRCLWSVEIDGVCGL